MIPEVLNIIHLPHRTDRLQNIKQEAFIQKTSYSIWNGIIDNENRKRGISKAHKQIVSYAKKEKLNSIIIAEDDIQFTASGAFDYFVKNEPLDYDLYLGGIYFGEIKSDNSVLDFAGLTLYKISHRFYNIFLNINEEKDIDRELANKGKFIVCKPFVVTQLNGYSDNAGEYRDYSLCLTERKLFKQ